MSQANKPSTAEPTPIELPTTSGPLYAILALCVAGLGVAIFLVRHKLHITLDPTYVSSCNLGGAINCDKVNVSDRSELFHLPISLYAIPTYAVTAYLGVQALRALNTTDAAIRRLGSTALSAVAGIGLLTSLFSLYLAWYSTVHVEAYCLYCISLYVVNFGITALAIAAGPKTVGNAISRAVTALTKFAEPVPISLAVAVIAGGLAWYGYDATRLKLENEYKAKIDQQLKGLDVAENAPSAAQPPVTGSVAPAQGSDSAKAAPPARELPTLQGLKKTPHGVQVGGKMTPEDGWSFALFPVNDNDYAYGNPNAKVTVIKISDYECPYCKYLAMTMEPVKAKYKDKVRFVMKQFPMNPNCNRYMAGYDKHPNACNASLAGVCAGRQGKFWEMHDKMYAEQPKLSPEENRKYAEELKLDLAKYDACLKDPATMKQIQDEIEEAHEAGINGAPRTYINGRLVTGSASTAILEYYIEKTLQNPDASPAGEVKVAAVPKSDGSHMIASKTAKAPFFIDPYEASLAKDGKALSLPDVEPAQVSWTEAGEACKKAGKRLCTEEEWVSACSGTPAVDENNNSQFADDNVEGAMYPYGAFYEAGVCRDQEDKYKGKAGKTGTMDKCRTPSGIFDLAGNIGEWSGATKETAGLMGGHNSSGERAACNQRSASFGVGNRNQTTGFRCCADTDVQQTTKAELADTDTDLMGKPVPAIQTKDATGAMVDSKAWKGKVTLVNFFASWCGPCKKEFPELVNLYKEHKAKGFQVVSIGVDREGAKSLEFAKGFDATWSVIEDQESELMGRFGVYSMPATFLIDRNGVIRFMDTGFKPEEQLGKLKSAVESLL
jgi:protein-disulfide isomerase/uncharacterized membrane protein